MTKEEEKVLEGEKGEGLRIAMNVVVKVGEVLGAQRLVKVVNAHVSGISYKNLGDEGLEFLRSLSENGVRFSVPTTINPAGMDLSRWKEMGVSEFFARRQMEIVEVFRRMGATPLLSCTPYKYSNIRYGDHVAWSESNAVLYANSVIGARTNRDGGPLALFEGLIGRVPLIGMHVKEGRKPTIIYDLAQVGEIIEGKGLFSELGYLIGTDIRKGVPAIVNPPGKLLKKENLKLFLAAVGTASGIAMALIQGVSPEFKEEDLRGLEVIRPSFKEVLEVREKFSTDADTVVLGCPHLFPEELEDIATRLQRCDRFSKEVIVFTSRKAATLASKYIKYLRKKGVKVFFDTCMVVADLRYMGVSNVIVDSAKAAYYLQSQGYDVCLLSREEALKHACEGN